MIPNLTGAHMFQMGGKKKNSNERTGVDPNRDHHSRWRFCLLRGGFVFVEFLELNGLVLFWVMKILGHLFRDHSIGPFWGDQTMQMYGKLEGFPLFWALFGLVIE